jgi:tellurite resistance protein
MMRSYPLNSPQAAARIVALALLADGMMESEELLVLDYMQAPEQLGLSMHQLDAVVEAFGQDIEVACHPGWAETGLVDPRTMAALMAEIDDPALRRKVLRLCISVVEADGRVHESESTVINAAVEHWGLHRDMFALNMPERPLSSV